MPGNPYKQVEMPGDGWPEYRRTVLADIARLGEDQTKHESSAKERHDQLTKKYDEHEEADTQRQREVLALITEVRVDLAGIKGQAKGRATVFGALAGFLVVGLEWIGRAIWP